MHAGLACTSCEAAGTLAAAEASLGSLDTRRLLAGKKGKKDKKQRSKDQDTSTHSLPC